MKKIWFATIVLAILAFAIGCTGKGSLSVENPAASTPVPLQTVTQSAGGGKADVITYLYTTKRAFALVFSGMSDKDTMAAILNELDKYNMKALFFLPAIRVAEEPDIAFEILKRGHAIGNDGLSEADLTRMNDDKVKEEIGEGQAIIQEKMNVTPQYLWNLGGKYNDSVLTAAKKNGLTFVKYTINLQGWEKKSAQEIQTYLENKITRGGVIALGTENREASVGIIDVIAQVSQEMGYSVQTLDYLRANQYERKPLQEIPGWDAAKINADYVGAQYRLIYNGNRSKPTIVLTFDDWGGDYAVTRLLDILDKYNIKASFFLRGDGVSANPNLARAIAEDGMDVGNHTYTHPNTTEIAPEQIQQEIVLCHQALTEALQRKPDLVFRPPYGEFGEETARAIAATGYTDIAMYDVASNDTDTLNMNKDQIINTVEQNASGGSIILFHMMIQLETYKALPDIITYYQDRGYEFTTMSKLISSGVAESTNLSSAAPQESQELQESEQPQESEEPQESIQPQESEEPQDEQPQDDGRNGRHEHR